MEDYKKRISNGSELTSKLIDFDCIPEVVEGSLIDNYFFEGMENMNFSRGVKGRKYVMILERYVNEWSSIHELILTDNEKYYQDTLAELKIEYERAVNA